MIEKCDVLVIIAHPDDETFVSGTLCLLADAGFHIALVCITDGENGSVELFQLVASNMILAEVRRRELALSAWVLGVRETVFLGQPDVPPGGWQSGDAWNSPKLIADLAQAIRGCNPQLIITHGPLGGYGHPAHCEASRCVMAASKEVEFSGSVFSFAGKVGGAFFSWRFDQPSDVLIDSRGYLRRRVASLCYHQTQAEFFLTPYFPRTLRAARSAIFALLFLFTEAGRKRLPIMTPTRFFKKYPVEGLVMQAAPRDGRPHFFRERLRDDPRVRIVA